MPSGLSCVAEHPLSMRFLVPVVSVPHPVHNPPLTHEQSSNTQCELKLFTSPCQDQSHLPPGSGKAGAAKPRLHFLAAWIASCVPSCEQVHGKPFS